MNIEDSTGEITMQKDNWVHVQDHDNIVHPQTFLRTVFIMYFIEESTQKPDVWY